MNEPTYNTLKTTVLSILEEGRELARQAVGRQKVDSYWQVGREIDAHLVATGRGSAYGDQIIAQLAEDTGFQARRIYKILQFYRCFEIVPTSALLGWSHYAELLPLPDEQRAFYESEAGKRGWSVRELRAQIKAGTFDEVKRQSEKGEQQAICPARGELYTYRVLEVGAESVIVDLGFGVEREIGGRYDFDVREVVRSEMVEGLVRLSPFDCAQDDRSSPAYGKKKLYTYKATVERVVDGDTIRVRVDLGFNTWIRHTLRLRGIDTPELPSPEGERAKAYVKRVLGGVSFIVVRTFGRGRYGRYVADVFLGKDERRVVGEGRYLNRALVERGMARRV